MKSVGSIIKEARLNKKLTLKELGYKLSLTHGHLSNIENDKRKPSKHVLLQLSRELDLDIAELMVFAGYSSEKEAIRIKKGLEEVE